MRTSLGARPWAWSSLGVEVDHDGALLAAVDVGHDGALDGDKLGPDEVEAVVVELLLGEVVAGEGELEDGDRGGGEVDDLRGEDAGGQLAEFEFGGGGDLGVGGIERGAGLQVDLDDGLAAVGGGFDVLDVVDEGGEGLFVRGGEATFELFRLEPGVLPGDRNDRDIDVREDVGRGCG